jgi:hypothetical protein
MKNLLLAVLLGCVVVRAIGEPVSVQVKVIDDLGAPVAGADVLVMFQDFVSPPISETVLKSDAEGMVRAQGETPVGVTLRAWKPGHYETETEFSISPKKPIERTYVLPRVLNPIPLFAARIEYLKLPVQNEWLGYDFEARDWVAPHGKGQRSDIRFRYKKDFSGWTLPEDKMASARQTNRDKSEEEIRFFYGKWDGVLEVSFANPKEGMIEEGKRFLPYSLLKLPHLASEAGYEPTRRYEANTYKGMPPERATGFFLRTRVQLDADGDIVSANYAKIYGDLRFDARGTVRIWYYFNPTPNDRNLEFDVKRNLLPERKASDRVMKP